MSIKSILRLNRPSTRDPIDDKGKTPKDSPEKGTKVGDLAHRTIGSIDSKKPTKPLPSEGLAQRLQVKYLEVQSKLHQVVHKVLLFLNRCKPRKGMDKHMVGFLGKLQERIERESGQSIRSTKQLNANLDKYKNDLDTLEKNWQTLDKSPSAFWTSGKIKKTVADSINVTLTKTLEDDQKKLKVLSTKLSNVVRISENLESKKRSYSSSTTFKDARATAQKLGAIQSELDKIVQSPASSKLNATEKKQHGTDKALAKYENTLAKMNKKLSNIVNDPEFAKITVGDKDTIKLLRSRRLKLDVLQHQVQSLAHTPASAKFSRETSVTEKMNASDSRFNLQNAPQSSIDREIFGVQKAIANTERELRATKNRAGKLTGRRAFAHTQSKRQKDAAIRRSVVPAATKLGNLREQREHAKTQGNKIPN